MSGSDRPITDALHELAEQAADPRPMASAAWREGRRRRHAAVSAAAAGVAAVTAAAVLVPLSLASAPARPGRGVVSFTLATPIEFRQVARISSAPCPPGSGGLPVGPPPSCVYLTRTAVTATRLRSLRAEKIPGGCGYILAFSLTPVDGRKLGVVTSNLARLPSPRNQLAIIVGGRVIMHPTVQGQITTNGEISFGNGCAGSRAKAEHLYRELRDR